MNVLTPPEVRKFIGDRAVEDFSHELLTELEAEKDTAHDKLKSIDAEIQSTMQKILNANSSVSTLEQVHQHVSETREARKKAIANGEDCTSLDNRLSSLFDRARALENDIELAKDVVEALTGKEESLRSERMNTEATIEVLMDKIQIVNICLAAKEYNEKAAALAPAAKAFNELLNPVRHTLDKVLPRFAHDAGFWGHTALGNIPALRTNWKSLWQTDSWGVRSTAGIDQEQSGPIHFYRANGI
jgi:chromosome segregation ATPase